MTKFERSPSGRYTGRFQWDRRMPFKQSHDIREGVSINVGVAWILHLGTKGGTWKSEIFPIENKDVSKKS